MAIIPKYLGRQLSKPIGFWGLLVARLMNIYNRGMYLDAYKLLHLKPGSNFLEIGFGNGAFIGEIIEKISPGKYIGIDISETMIKTASRRNSKLIATGAAQLLKANAMRLPFKDAFFDHVFTANTIYFWENPKKVMSEIKRVLHPGGVFVVSLSTRETMEKSDYHLERFVLYSQQEVEELFVHAGFKNIVTSYRKQKLEDVLCVKGVC